MSIDNSGRFNPFPGLRPFSTEEDFLFFGREKQTNELLGLLREHRFIAVVGTSGSGKSSLVRAGLLPALHGGTMAQAGSSWEVLLLRPGGNPIANLARAFVDADLYDPDDEESLPRVVATLNRSGMGLVEAVRQSDLPPETNLLVVVDQFEELFRFRQSGATHEEVASAFVKLLLAAAREANQRIYVTITMRSDYLGECSHISGLAEAVNDGEYLIPRLTREQRRAAIEMPVSVGGAMIAHRLTQKLLNDVGDDADHLPVLQHALMRIFDFWSEDHAEDEPLDLRHYERAGGLQQALSLHSDEVYDALPSDRLRLVTEKLFKALTERGTDNRGIRRPTRLGALCEIIGAEQDEVIAVVDAFRSPGRTFLMPMSDVELTPEKVIDISHESLMRVWKRLDRWVEEESQSARIYRRLADTAALHAEGKAGIYHDPDLQIALSWRENEHPTDAWAARYHADFERAMAFLDDSREAQLEGERRREEARQRELEQARKLAEAERIRAEEQKRSAHRMKWLSSAMGVVAVVALIAFGMAWVARQDARENEREAQHNAQLAKQNEHRAQENAKLAKQNENDAQKNAELAKKKETDAQRSAEFARQSAQNARAAEKAATAAREKEAGERLKAVMARKEAEQSQRESDENFRKALDTVDMYLTRVSESRLLRVPGLQPLRKELLELALKYYQGFVSEQGNAKNGRGNDPALQKKLAEAYTRLARVTGELGSKADALEAFDKALVILKKLLQQNPKDPKLNLDLVAHYRTVGNLQRQIGDTTGALASLGEASKILETLSPGRTTSGRLALLGGTTVSKSFRVHRSNDPTILATIADVYSETAAVHAAANDLDAAQDNYYQALYMRRRLVTGTKSGTKRGNVVFTRKGRLTTRSFRSSRSGVYYQYYQVQLRAGQGYFLEVRSPDFNTEAVVAGPAGRFLARDAGGAGGRNSRLFFRAFVSGPHRVWAVSSVKGRTGAFTLTVFGEEKTKGKPVFDKTDRLNANDPRDEWGRSFRSHQVELQAGQRCVIEVQSPGDEIDPIVVAYDGDRIVPEGDKGILGVSLRLVNGFPIIVTTVKGSPAQKAGLRAGEAILAVDGKSTKSKTLADAVKIINGSAGTLARLRIVLAGKERDVNVTRRRLNLGGSTATRRQLSFVPPRTGRYKINVTSADANKLGAYRLTVSQIRIDDKFIALEYGLARQWIQMGSLFSGIGLREAAGPYQEEARNILAGLVAGYPNHALANDARRDLAVSHENIGELLVQQGKSAEALASYEKAARVRKELADKNPAVTTFQAELAATYYAVARLQVALKQNTEALAMFREANLRLFLAHVTAPDVKPYRLRLARQHLALANLQRKLNDRDDALKNLKQAHDLLNGLPPESAEDFYTLAQVQSARGLLAAKSEERKPLADAAMKSLQAAIAKGLTEVERVKATAEFEALRARADFKKSVGDLAAKVKKLVWNLDLEAAKTQAAREKKDVLIYFGGGDWATLDVSFRKRIFDDPEFVDYASKHYVLVKFESFRHRSPLSNNSQRLRLYTLWSVSSVPAMFLMDPDGRRYQRHQGASRLNVRGFIQLLEGYRIARVRRDRWLQQAADAKGVQKAVLLDKALVQIPGTYASEYTDLIKTVRRQIVTADPDNVTGLRGKYMGGVVQLVGAEVAALLNKRELDSALQKLNAAIAELQPTGVQANNLYRIRARVHIGLGQFREAVRDFDRTPLDYTSPNVWFRHIYALVRAGDTEGYRRVADAMLRRFGESRNAEDAFAVLWACSLVPDAVADPTRLIPFEKTALAGQPRGYYHHGVALARYRAGDYQKALEHLRKSSDPKLRFISPLNDLLFALTCKRLGREQETTQWLKKLLARRDEGKPLYAGETNLNLRGPLALDILLGEAAAVFEASPLAADPRFQSLRARAYAPQKQWDKAVAVYGQLLAKQPGDVQLLIERGRCYGHLKQSDKSAADFAKAIELRNIALKAKRGLLQKQPAVAEHREALAEAYRDLADTQARVGKPAEAATTLAQMAGLWTDDGDMLYATGKQIAALVPLAEKEKAKSVGDLALKTLRQAISSGRPYAIAIGRDEQLHPLRSRPDFQKLLAGVQVRTRYQVAGAVIRQFKGHTSGVEVVVVTPDGRQAVSGGYDGHLRFWDIATGKQLRAIRVGNTSGIAISADGRKLLVGLHDKTMRLFDYDSGKELQRFQGHTANVWQVALSGDGRRALSASNDKTVRLWNVETGKEIRQFVHDAGIWSVAFSPDDNLAVTGDLAQTVRVWDVKSGKELYRWDTSQEVGRLPGYAGHIWCVAFTPDGQHVIGGGSDSILRLWDAKSGKLLRRFVGHPSWVRAIGFPSNPGHMVSIDRSGNLIVCDLQTGEELARTQGPGSRIGLAVLPGGGRVMTADQDKLVRLWLISPEVFRARVHARQSRFAEAKTEYDAAVKALPKEADLRVERGRFLARYGKWQQAADDFSIALKANADDWQLWADRGRCLAMAEQPDKAAADFAKAIEIIPGPQWRLRQRLCEELAQWDDVFAATVKRQPEQPDLWLGRARHYARFSQWDKAVEAYSRLPDKRTTNISVVEQACALLLAGNTDAYRKLCLRQLEQDGKTEARFTADNLARASVLALGGIADPTLAIELGRLAFSLDAGNSKDPRFLHTLGLACYRAGQFDEAVKHFTKSNSRGWPELNALGLALAHHQMGHADKAREWFDKAAKLLDESIPATPNQPISMGAAGWLPANVLRREAEGFLNAAHRREAEIALRDRKWQEAIGHLDHLIKANPDFWPDRRSRARAYAALKQTKEAIRDYETVISLKTAPAELVGEYADYLLQSRWTVLEPAEMKSEGGATLARLPDGSILAGGESPEKDVYTLKIKTAPKDITALKLEVLTDDSLPNKGPGRAPNGNFVLNELTVTVAGKPVAFKQATATYSQSDYLVKGAIDGIATTGWGIYQATNRPQMAVFELVAPGGDGGASELVVKLHFNYGDRHTFGRFRLSATTDPRPTSVVSIPDPVAKLARAYHQSGKSKEAIALLQKRPKPIVFEAEAGKSIPAPWKVFDDKSASGGRFVAVPDKSGKWNADDPKKELVYRFNVSRSGRYKLLLRVRTPSGKHDSFGVHLDGEVAQPPASNGVALNWTNATGQRPPDSKPGGAHVTVTFRNDSNRGVRLYWIELNDRRRLYGQVPSGGSYSQGTYSGHTWLITDDNDKPLGYFVAGPAKESLAVIPAEKGSQKRPDAKGPWHEALRELPVLTAGEHTLRIAPPKDGSSLDSLTLIPEMTPSVAIDDPLLLILAHSKLGQHAEARKDLDRAFEWLGANESDEGLQRLAVEAVTALLEHAPRDATLLGRRGQLWTRLGEFNRAAEDFKKAAGIEPKDAELKSRLAQLSAGVLAVWNFDFGTEGWKVASQDRLKASDGRLQITSTGIDPHIATPVAVPAGFKELTIRARITKPIDAQLFWGTNGRGNYAEDRSQHFFMQPAKNGLGEYKVYFHTATPLRSLRIDPGGEANLAVEIDWITLREVSAETVIAASTSQLKQKPNDQSLRRLRATAYRTLKRWQEAVADYDKLITPNTRDVRLFAARAAAYQRIREWKKAIPDWSKAAALNPKQARYVEQQAGCHERLRQWSEAVQLWTKYCGLVSNPARGFQRRANCRDRLHEWDKALADYTLAIERSPTDGRPEFHYLRGNHWAKRGEWQKAAKDFAVAMEKPSPGWIAGTWERMAIGFLMAGDAKRYGQARREILARFGDTENAFAASGIVNYWALAPIKPAEITKLLAIDKRARQDDDVAAMLMYRAGRHKEADKLIDKYTHTASLYLRALIQHELGNHEAALGWMQKAGQQQAAELARAPRGGVPIPPNWPGWARALVLQREAQKLIVDPLLAEVNKAIEANGKDAQSRLRRGRLYVALARPTAALTDFAKAVELKPDFHQAWFAHGEQLVALGKREDALASFGKAIQIDSKQLSYYAARVKVLHQLQRWKKAADDYDKLVTPKSEDIPLISDSVTAYLYAGRHKDAERNCRRLIALRQNTSDWHRLGWALGAQNRRKESIEAYSKAIKLNPRNRWSYSGRGDNHVVLGQWELALKDYSKAIELGTKRELWRFHEKRGQLQARRAEWKKAADDFARIDDAPPRAKVGWSVMRDRSLLWLLLKETKKYQQDANKTRKLVGGKADTNQARWLGYVFVMADGTLTKDKMQQLLKIARRADKSQQPRLTAAIQFRAGNYKQAADLFSGNPGGPEYQFLAAMSLNKLGKSGEARKLLAAANTWMQQQRDTKPKQAVPVDAWQDWALYLILQREAEMAINGKKVSPIRPKKRDVTKTGRSGKRPPVSPRRVPVIAPKPKVQLR